MYKILILGNTGLLGNAVEKHFRNQYDYSVTTACRNPELSPSKSICFDAIKDNLDSLGNGYDYVINCIGVIKPFMIDDPESAIMINALFPWRLARWCEISGMRLIHITTDCVYSGAKGKYIESDLHDALDAYGKSKSLGECVPHAMVLRTSIIGEEIHKNASLVAWAKMQKGKKIGGYSTHYWNGITTNTYAKICDKIIRNDLFEPDLFHIFAADDVSKLEMMQLFNKKYDLDMEIEEKTPPVVDRTLRTKKNLCEKLDIPTVSQMIDEMA